MSNTKNYRQNNQYGLVSFMVVTVLMLVLTLIVMSYARIVQREQVQTLDRQLNVQAEYAAESGINDAINTLKDRPTMAESPYTKCSGPGSFINEAGAGLDPDLGNGVSYSCLLVDPMPSMLKFDNVGKDKSTVTPIKSADGSQIKSITIKWKYDGTGCPNVGEFPDNLPASCKTGILRLEQLLFNGGETPGELLMANRGIVFAQPQSAGGGSVTFDDVKGNNQGKPVAASCSSASGECTITITGSDLTGYLRMRSIYLDNNDVEITANGGTKLIGSQVVIDATGRAGGVLKRLKVHAQIPINKGITAGEYALQSKETQCKKFSVTNSSLNVAGSLPECNI